MKKIFIILIVVSASTFFSPPTFAQKKNSYVPEKGYWELVSNKKDKKTVTVKFYNDLDQMIYETTLNCKMNPDRLKVRRQLYYALQDAYNKWALHQPINSNVLIAKKK